MLDRDGLDSGQGSLRRRFRRAKEPFEPGPPRSLGGDEPTGHGPHATVQRQLSESGVLSQALGRDLVRRREDGESDRQIEAGALFPQARRREVDREPPERPLELGARYAAPDALLRLLAGLVR